MQSGRSDGDSPMRALPFLTFLVMGAALVAAPSSALADDAPSSSLSNDAPREQAARSSSDPVTPTGPLPSRGSAVWYGWEVLLVDASVAVVTDIAALSWEHKGPPDGDTRPTARTFRVVALVGTATGADRRPVTTLGVAGVF
jgi:hypothetical protein